MYTEINPKCGTGANHRHDMSSFSCC